MRATGAKGRPFNRKLMAAMAQLDFGACGYECQTYAEALADGSEEDLSLCQPGGKDTAQKLDALMAEGPIVAVEDVMVNGAKATAVEPAASQAGGTGASGEPMAYGKKNPFPAALIANEKLNGAGSAKDTRFIAVDIAGSGMSYEAGDSLGVLPQNCYSQVEDLLRVMELPDGTLVEVAGVGMTLREALVSHFEIGSPSRALLEAMADVATDAKDKQGLEDATSGKEVAGLAEDPQLIDLFVRFTTARPTGQQLVNQLKKMRPRLYSISSSPAAYPTEVHLTVGVVRYKSAGRERKGVASTYLADRVMPGQTVRVFVHQSPKFRPPSDGDTPMIMVGPGTGIAPFRAFLQERQVTGARGDNWLFFGDQHEATDYLYRDEIERWQESGLLTRVDTAFSRDGAHKLYVQHRMAEHAAELWAWLKRGAHFYVCGDASRMAKDVHETLVAIIAEQGGMDAAGAESFVKTMSETGRLQRDVY